MTITKEDIDQLDDWLSSYRVSMECDIENSHCTTPSYYTREYARLKEESMKMISLINKLRDHFGVK